MALTPDWIFLPKYYLPTTGGMQTFTNRLAQHFEIYGRVVAVVTKARPEGRPILEGSNAEQHTCELCSEHFWEAAAARLARLPFGRRVLAVGLEYEDQVDLQLTALVQMKEDQGHRVGLRVTTTFDLAHRLTPHRAALLNRLDAVFVLNAHMASEAEQHGIAASKVAMLPLLIDSSQFAPAAPNERASLRAAFNLPISGFVALWTGRLCSRKQLEHTITAWTKSGVTGVLWIVGDDEAPGRPAERELARSAKSLGSSAPAFQPALPPHAMSTPYKAADLFVSTSQVEGMSNSMLEALAVGLPVVAYDIPGNTDLYRHVHSPGWHLVANGDIAAVADGIRMEAQERSADQTTLRATREASLARFSWSTVSQILQEKLGML